MILMTHAVGAHSAVVSDGAGGGLFLSIPSLWSKWEKHHAGTNRGLSPLLG